MPTIMTHPAAAVGLFPWFRGRLGRPAILAIGMALTVAPDLDVIGFWLGVPYGDLLGHRGLTHSLPFALAVGGLAASIAARIWCLKFGLLWLYFTLCLASHGILDALTSGGLGVAFFAPFSDQRYFFELRPVRVSPIAVSDFLSRGGTAVLTSELRWIWLPALALGLAGLIAGRAHRVRIFARSRRRPLPVEAE